MREQKPAVEFDTVPLSKREQILAAAREEFLEYGYAATTMDAVAARAGVSKATIYAHFENKQTLFGAMITNRCEQSFDKLPVPRGDARSLRTELHALGLMMIRLIYAPEAIALYRVVIAESARQPELGEIFHVSGPARAMASLTAYFQKLKDKGLLAIPDARLTAEMFVGMLKGQDYMRRLLNMEEGGCRPEDLVEAAVETLLRAYALQAEEV
ncbi:TetR/AcrR family transcriptional regulator [Telmatospirillum sp. J64-1]|uniref:TetR/AcrR family transcriptional regulator n=1 Tax=Telmatospirillum sp. J64-1 TaxID=2502183 RepID=UPI00163D9D7C|nr:TetR/AcrR family transcriptional regulator [Telmatospirillum sp. J64-1]